jgi:hypothetical protein
MEAGSLTTTAPMPTTEGARLAEYSASESSIANHATASWQIVSLVIPASLIGLAILAAFDSSLQVSLATTLLWPVVTWVLEVGRRQALKEQIAVDDVRSRMIEIESELGMRRQIYERLLARWDSRDQSPEWKTLNQMERMHLERAYTRLQGPFGIAPVISAAFRAMEFAWSLLVVYRWAEYAGAFD